MVLKYTVYSLVTPRPQLLASLKLERLREGNNQGRNRVRLFVGGGFDRDDDLSVSRIFILLAPLSARRRVMPRVKQRQTELRGFRVQKRVIKIKVRPWLLGYHPLSSTLSLSLRLYRLYRVYFRYVDIKL